MTLSLLVELDGIVDQEKRSNLASPGGISHSAI